MSATADTRPLQHAAVHQSSDAALPAAPPQHSGLPVSDRPQQHTTQPQQPTSQQQALPSTPQAPPQTQTTGQDAPQQHSAFAQSQSAELGEQRPQVTSIFQLQNAARGNQPGSPIIATLPPSVSAQYASAYAAAAAAAAAAQAVQAVAAGSMKPSVGSEEWLRQRRENHKEVERRRRETINDGINELAKLIPDGEKNKGRVLQRAVQYILQLKQQDAANMEKWTLEKLLCEQAIQELSAQVDALKNENDQLRAQVGAGQGGSSTAAPVSAPASSGNQTTATSAFASAGANVGATLSALAGQLHQAAAAPVDNGAANADDGPRKRLREE